MARYEINSLPGEINFECKNDMLTRALQNAKNLLMCRMGEVPYDRYRGFNVALYDLPEDEFRLRLLPELDRLMRWEPDVEVVDATTIRNADGSVTIVMTIETEVE